MSPHCNGSKQPSRLVAWGLISALALIAFSSLVLAPTQMLYSDHSDMLAMHVPMKHFLVQSFQQTGRLPYWCSSSFAGLPLVHDVQLAAFYPLHWPLYLLNPDHVGAAVSWLVVLHVMIAGWGMFCYARCTSLSWFGSLAAAVGWMFAGKWMMHMIDGGHSILAPLAWLPWVLYCLHRAMIPDTSRRQSITWSITAGLVFGTMVLGTHPQITFYSGIGIAISIVVSALTSLPISTRGKRLRAGIACGAVCAAIAVGVGAIQLLPALESTPETSRASGVSSTDILPGGIRVLMNFIGPAIVCTNASGGWEDRGGFALVTLFLALITIIARRNEPVVKQHLWMCGILIAYAMGMALLVQWLPGFRLFRQATRMILVAALPMAWLAGAGVDALATVQWNSQRLRSIAIRVVIVAVILCGGIAIRGWASGETVRWHFYWASLIFTLPIMFWLLGATDSWTVSARRRAWACLLMFDAMMLAVPSIEVKSFNQVYHAGEITRALTEMVEPGDRILDRDASEDSYAAPMGTGMSLALLHQLEPVRGYNSFDLASYRRYLKRISGDSSPLRPFEDAWTYPLLGDFPIKDQSLTDLLGVRYLIAPEGAKLANPWQPTTIGEASPNAYSVIEGGIVSLPAYRVYENRNAYPKLWIVDKEYVSSDSASEISLPQLLAEGRTVIQPANLTIYEPNVIVAQLEVTTSSLLVLSDAYFPGWICEVDGQRRPIMRVEGLFRGVWIDAGAREVRFSFQPKSLQQGRWISLLTILGSVGTLCILRLNASCVSTSEAQSSGT